MPTPVIITLLLVIYVAVCFAALVMNHRLSQTNHHIDELAALVQLRDTTPADRKHLVDYAIVTHEAVPASGISDEFFDSINEMLNGPTAPVGEVLPDNVVPIKDTTRVLQPSTSSRCHICGLPFSEHLDNAAHSFEPEQPQPAIEL